MKHQPKVMCRNFWKWAKSKGKIPPPPFSFHFQTEKRPSVLQYTTNKIHNTIPIDFLFFTFIEKHQIYKGLSQVFQTNLLDDENRTSANVIFKHLHVVWLGCS